MDDQDINILLYIEALQPLTITGKTLILNASLKYFKFFPYLRKVKTKFMLSYLSNIIF